jgi:uncharacterized paraquat-inducible protein A
MFGNLPKGPWPKALFFINLALLVAFPLSWFAPLMRAGLLPIFRLSEISVISGLAALWQEGEIILAFVVAVFALVAPVVKTLFLILIHLGAQRPGLIYMAHVMGKLAMADVFLIALYIALSQGLAVGRMETAWGLWVFTACVLISLAVGLITERMAKSFATG